MKLLKRFWPLLILIPFFSFLFFFKFDWLTLANWDEAWYGAIARNIANTGNFLKMQWNGKPYYDHPPIGFIIMALSIKMFGATEFAVRLPAILLGLGSIVLMYFIGTELFKKKIVGFASSLILGTSVWYLIRVRSGDLDSTFVFFYLLTIYLSLKSAKRFSLFPLTMASFAALVLSKTLVGLSAGLLIFINNMGPFIKSKKRWLPLILGVIVFLMMVFPWYYVQLKSYEHFFEEHFINVGMRNKGLSSYFHIEWYLPLFYLHMGIRKWYYIWLAGLGALILTFRFIKKPVFLILVWNFIILYPFLTTNQTQIWHLIPVYLPIALVASSGVFYAKEFFIKITKLKFLDKAADIIYIFIFVTIALLQVKNFYKEVYPTSRYTPDDVDISRQSAKFNKPIYLDDDFTPVAVFYSGKIMHPLISLPDDQKTALGFFKSDKKDFVLITRNYVLNILKENKIDFKLDYQNKAYSIISRP